MRSLLIAMVGLVVAGVGVARAETIPLLEQKRFWSNNIYYEFGPSEKTKTSAANFGHFEVTDRHTSDILPQELSGELHAYGSAWDDPDYGPATSNESSYYRVELDLDESTNYVLSAEIEGRDDGRYALGTARLELSIFDADLRDYQVLLSFASYGGYFLIPVSEAGVLAPGQYQLEVYAGGGGMNHSYDGSISGSGHASFSLTVPEPAAPLLAACALATLALLRRRATWSSPSPGWSRKASIRRV